MRKCEVIVDRLSVVCGKGSVVYVEDRQFEIASRFLKALDVTTEEPVEEAEKTKRVRKKKQ